MSERSVEQPAQRGDYPEKTWSLTKMMYAVGSALVLYRLLQCYGWLSFERLHTIPFGLPRFSFWFLADGSLFVLTMFTVAFTYRPISLVFRWLSPSSRAAGTLRSIVLGVVAAAAAFAVASPIFWVVEKHLGLIPMLIGAALSPLPILELILFVIAIALGNEIVFRGIVFRTLAGYASMPAAVLGSCLLFAFVCPVLGFLSSLILGASSAILFYKTRNLIASVTADAVFILAASGLTVYHSLMHS